MKKTTARANSNIALVKYWGKSDGELKLPVNSSLAIGLDAIYTVTTVEFLEDLKDDEVSIDGERFTDKEKLKVSEHLDLVREMAGFGQKARVVTKNNFPKGAGAASSASGFAALSLAASRAAGLDLSEKELSILARQGSGSASRSVLGGVCEWGVGENSENSYARAVDYPKEWDLKVLLVFVGDRSSKKIGSTEGMALSKKTSPYFEQAVVEAGENLEKIKRALNDSDWKSFGEVIEDECFRLHAVCMTTRPNILYWKGGTVDVFQKLLELREEGVDGFFTVDAGPHVHIVCKSGDAEKIKKSLGEIGDISEIVECGIGGPAEVINKHLF